MSEDLDMIPVKFNNGVLELDFDRSGKEIPCKILKELNVYNLP